MKKINQIFLLLISFISIFSDQCYKFTGVPSTENDCFNQLSDEQKNTLKKTHCCFFESDDQVDPKCVSLTQTQYDNIDDYIKYNEILWGYVNTRINCNSYYVNIYIYYFMLLILLIYI